LKECVTLNVRPFKATHSLFHAPKFSAEWGDPSDGDPPPGRELAQALLEQISRAVHGKEPERNIGANDWENTAWFFWIRFREHVYQVDIEASPKDDAPTLWHIGVSQVRGLLRALLTSRRRRFDVEDEFLQIVSNALTSIANVNNIEWLTEDEAVDRFC